MVKLVLIDDHKLIREGIKALLTEDETIEIAGEAASGNELLELLTTLSADIVLLGLTAGLVHLKPRQGCLHRGELRNFYT